MGTLSSLRRIWFMFGPCMGNGNGSRGAQAHTSIYTAGRVRLRCGIWALQMFHYILHIVYVWLGSYGRCIGQVYMRHVVTCCGLRSSFYVSGLGTTYFPSQSIRTQNKSPPVRTCANVCAWRTLTPERCLCAHLRRFRDGAPRCCSAKTA